MAARRRRTGNRSTGWSRRIRRSLSCATSMWSGKGRSSRLPEYPPASTWPFVWSQACTAKRSHAPRRATWNTLSPSKTQGECAAKRTSKRPKLVVGFAAETENLLDNAREKLKKKGCDLIVANDVSKERGVFGGDQNTVQLVSASGVESWGLMSKQDVAQRLMKQLAGQLSTGKA